MKNGNNNIINSIKIENIINNTNNKDVLNNEISVSDEESIMLFVSLNGIFFYNEDLI